jgi:hypothetical protein
MSRKPFLTAIGFLALFLAVTSANAQENIHKNELLRLDRATVADQCVLVTPEGSYSIPKGSLIEISFEYPAINGCGPHSSSINTTYNGVLKAYNSAGWSITTDADHPFTTVAFLFRAHKRGHDTITLAIDGTEYVYEIEVQ